MVKPTKGDKTDLILEEQQEKHLLKRLISKQGLGEAEEVRRTGADPARTATATTFQTANLKTGASLLSRKYD